MNLPNWLLLVVVGIICLVIDYVWGAAPPIAHTLLKIVGYITLIIGVVLLLVQLLGIK
jgi:predicted acyltransferase